MDIYNQLQLDSKLLRLLGLSTDTPQEIIEGILGMYDFSEVYAEGVRNNTVPEKMTIDLSGKGIVISFKKKDEESPNNNIQSGLLEKINHSSLPEDMTELTPREEEMLCYMVMGKSSEDICNILSINDGTLNTHRRNAYPKLGAHSILEAAYSYLFNYHLNWRQSDIEQALINASWSLTIDDDMIMGEYLTRKQVQASYYLSHGLDNKTIAELMGTNEKTVKEHVKKVNEKLGFNSRLEAASYVWDLAVPNLHEKLEKRIRSLNPDGKTGHQWSGEDFFRPEGGVYTNS